MSFKSRIGVFSIMLVAVSMCVAIVSGCGSSTTTQTTGPATSQTTAATVAPTTTSATQAASSTTTAAAKQFTVGVVLASATNPLYVSMLKGIEAKAAELGVKVKSVVANEDQTLQVNGMQDLITAKVDALLVSPITVEGAVVGYEAAKKAGIPVISIARKLTNRPDLERAYVGIDILADGGKIGEWIANKIGGKGKVAMLLGVAGASFTMDLAKGVKAVFAKYPDIQVVFEINSPITRDAGLSHGTEALTAHPDVSAIYCANDELALGVVQAAKAANLQGKVVITGYNGTPPAIEAIKTGDQSMTIALRATNWGSIGMQAVYDILSGKDVGSFVQNQEVLVDSANVTTLTAADLK